MKKRRVYEAVIEIISSRQDNGYYHKIVVDENDIERLMETQLGRAAFSPEGRRAVEEDHETQLAQRYPKAPEVVTTITITCEVAHDYRRGEKVKQGDD